jgi:hypothetical protein
LGTDNFWILASPLSKAKLVVHENRIKLVTENPNEVVVSDTTPIIAKLWGTHQMKKKYIPNPSVIHKSRGRPPKTPQTPPKAILNQNLLLKLDNTKKKIGNKKLLCLLAICQFCHSANCTS